MPDQFGAFCTSVINFRLGLLATAEVRGKHFSEKEIEKLTLCIEKMKIALDI